MRILGIDPGFTATGYGVIDWDQKGRKIQLLETGTIEPKPKDLLPNKIDKVYRNLDEIILQYSPTVMVLEKLYSHYKHPTTACILGHVRGAICLLCAHRNLKLVEYSVKAIRKSLIGQGNASKQQMQGVVADFLNIDGSKLTLDASDALVLAVGYALGQRHTKFLGIK
jgi:crossover junction endodeoxyribonuclease RuvC